LGVSTPQPPKSIKIRKQDIQLTEAEREQVAQREGQLLYKQLIKATVQPSWVRKTDGQRRAEINAIHQQITKDRPAFVVSLWKKAYGDMPFEEFLDRYNGMSDAQQNIVRPMLTSKTIEWKTQARRGQVSSEDKDRISAKISTMKPN